MPDQSFTKRQKERARQEKQRNKRLEKEARRRAKAEQPNAPANDGTELVAPELAVNVPASPVEP